jgi:hypothetical protein
VTAPVLGGLNSRLASISTVLTVAGSKDLVALPLVKSALDITTSASDKFLKFLISAVSAEIAQYCNRTFPLETVLNEFWPARDAYPYQVPGGLNVLQLTRWPVASVASVTENGNALVEGTDFRVGKDEGHLFRLDGNAYPCRWPPYALAVTFAGGFNPIPPDVQDACLRMITARWIAKGRDPNMKGENIPGVREVQYWIPNTPTGNMAPEIQDILDNYRTPVIA